MVSRTLDTKLYMLSDQLSAQVIGGVGDSRNVYLSCWNYLRVGLLTYNVTGMISWQEYMYTG